MEYSRSSPLFLLSFSLLLLLSRLSSFSAQPPVPAREPERPGVEWHKRKRKGEKREGRKESGERSRGRSETETAKPPINFSLTTISTHNFPSLHLSRRKSPRLHHLLSLSLLIARVSLRENKNWTREDWFGERSKKRDSVQLRCNLISTEWWWKKMEWWGKWRGGRRHPFKISRRDGGLSSYRAVRSWIIQSSNCRRVNGSRKGVYPSVSKEEQVAALVPRLVRN